MSLRMLSNGSTTPCQSAPGIDDSFEHGGGQWRRGLVDSNFSLTQEQDSEFPSPQRRVHVPDDNALHAAPPAIKREHKKAKRRRQHTEDADEQPPRPRQRQRTDIADDDDKEDEEEERKGDTQSQSPTKRPRPVSRHGDRRMSKRRRVHPTDVIDDGVIVDDEDSGADSNYCSSDASDESEEDEEEEDLAPEVDENDDTKDGHASEQADDSGSDDDDDDSGIRDIRVVESDEDDEDDYSDDDSYPGSGVDDDNDQTQVPDTPASPDQVLASDTEQESDDDNGPLPVNRFTDDPID